MFPTIARYQATRLKGYACLVAAALVAGCDSAPVKPEPTVPASATSVTDVNTDNYRRAIRFTDGEKRKYIRNSTLTAHWIGEDDRFWYLRELPDSGKEFVLVDAQTAESSPAFDHAFIANEINVAINLEAEKQAAATDPASGDGADPAEPAVEAKPATAQALPFDTFTYNEAGGIDFTAIDLQFRCSAESCETSEPQQPVFGPLHTVSPDGQWAVYHKDHNLWLKSSDGRIDQALTTDGEDGFGYGVQTGTSTAFITMNRLMGGIAPQVIWSPDSKRILTQHTDERKVGTLSLVEEAPRDGSLRSRTWSMRYAYAGDEHKPMATFVVFNLPDGGRIDVDYPPIDLVYSTMTGPASREVWWHADSMGFGFVHRKAYALGYTLNRVNLETGKVTPVFDRVSDRPSTPGFSTPMPPQVADLANGGMIWYSDESGYGHFYYRDPAGNVTQLTSGDWNANAIARVDEQAEQLYFFGSQAEAEGNPYYYFLYRVDFSGKNLVRLTPEQATHTNNFGDLAGFPKGRFSPSGKYFIDSWSNTTDPGQSELRDSDGKLVKVLETTDISALEADGWNAPQPFEVMATDGVTRLYGTLYFPADFDPSRSYPIIDSIYPGPQVWNDDHRFLGSIYSVLGGPQAVAELGFIAFTVDGRGTLGRSRDFNYPPGVNLLDKAGFLEDHVATIRQLAERHPFIDADRVGIFGWSGGGYASTHAILTYPEVFKVAVSGAGNHDPRTYLPVWGESYQGPFNDDFYKAGSNAHLAKNLQGKLFLVHGALDDNVHPSNTMAVVQALIDADKDFDLLILPNSTHTPGDDTAYFRRRLWDYFVQNLGGMEPPGERMAESKND
jgi:dipeptidyl-peptidase-4